MKNQSTVEQILDSISQTAPPLLTRTEIQRITGGAVNAKTLANLDSLNDGSGIPDRIRVGSRIAYPTSAVIAWLRNQIKTISGIKYTQQ